MNKKQILILKNIKKKIILIYLKLVIIIININIIQKN